MIFVLKSLKLTILPILRRYFRSLINTDFFTASINGPIFRRYFNTSNIEALLFMCKRLFPLVWDFKIPGKL